MKLLLYCTKQKPLLLCKPKADNNKPCRLLTNDIGKSIYNCLKEDAINGKIVGECDYEVEEIKALYDECYRGYVFENVNEYELRVKSCLTNEELGSYLKIYNNNSFEKCGYAIYIKNLVIYDEPKELSDYMYGSDKALNGARTYYNYYFTAKHRFTPVITKAPQNMCYVSYNGYDKDVLISIRPEWLCKILNGEKTIEVRRKVLKEMV